MMDSEGDDMRQQMDDTMADLTDKLEDLGDQASGTAKTVKNSINSVRDTFDVKFQVRRHPLTIIAGATALGFVFGFRPDGNARRDSRNSARDRPCAGANGDRNGADTGHSPVVAAPSRLANLEEMFKPEITALRGVAVGALLEVVRGSIMKQAAKPPPRSAGDASVSDGTLADKGRTS